ncbi:MAG: 2,3-bisphosphoglycerate-independent phosphoglycerate mutase [Firmicutes bacterium]|nr:2,3-bisphosphoglycerate-independent phosphoglycerate mutase [Bacillota bacterium]
MNKTLLCIIDGLGVNNEKDGNAAHAAGMENLEGAIANYPSTNIKASGPEVGLVDVNDPGNSEVGHNAIGSGQYIKQGMALLASAFETGRIYESATWKKLAANAKGKKLNMITLLSDGRAHSDIYSHMFPLLERCAKEGIKVAIHAAVDGRDTPIQSAMQYIEATRAHIKKVGADAKIVTVVGRGVMWMDRYELNTKMMSDAIDFCTGSKDSKGTVVKDISLAINEEYKKRPTMTDETMPPFVLEPDWLMKNGESVLLVNYRGDRAVGICKTFDYGKYLSKEQHALINKCVFAGIVEYDTEEKVPQMYLCPPPEIKNTLSEWLVKHGVRQYSVTETVKFGHLTYFFNGNRAAPFDKKLETWKEFKSDILNNMYNSAPKMQAEKITADAIEAVKSNKFDFIKINLSNPDMVGHTGDFDATVIACKTVDECIGRLLKVCKDEKVNLIITSDHGHAEIMKYPNGKPMSSHTNSLVPFVVAPYASGDKFKIASGEFGLTNIASTVCLLLGVKPNTVFNASIINCI